jgi:mono/diheme cytochrome c family protein
MINFSLAAGGIAALGAQLTSPPAAAAPASGKGKVSSTVPLNWREVFFTKCPMVSANNIDQELGWCKTDFKHIGVDYSYFRSRRENNWVARMRMPRMTIMCLIGLISLFSVSARSQLVECELAGIDETFVQNGCIAKTLTDQIGEGQGDSTTFGSSVYLIKRDPARSIRRGRQLFQRKFSLYEGLGPRVNFDSAGDIVETRALGAGLTDSCAACHGRPKGAAGFGGDVATQPDSRDAPHLLGLGLVEQLADEMTLELRASRDSAIANARKNQPNRRTRLRAKGIDFGYITVNPDGSVDTSQVEGVDEDLRVRPFFHHGQTVSIREFIIGALKDEMGLQAWDPILCAVTDPTNPQAMTSPAGFVYDPNLDSYERPAVCDSTEDSDEDGVTAEIDPALVDHMEFYLLNYFKPGSYQQDREAQQGRQVMRKTGCTSCHKANLRLDSDRRIADVETVYDPVNGIFNDLFATATIRFDIIDDGEVYPLLAPQGEAFDVENIFSDFKRHDLGPAFYEREYDGTLVTEFVTEPLWGVGSTAPYGHDGRSINLDAVIRRHGGEAANSAARYARLSARRRSRLLAFLASLVLFPPDDTASNLNPGDKFDEEGIQYPHNHGSINLGALFQIPLEGAE